MLIVGAGPAGTIAGLVAARAGARVCIVDRATFPRDKLCGDTVNPGTMTILRRLGLSAEIERRGLRVGGMILTGERGVSVEGRYPEGASGAAGVVTAALAMARGFLPPTINQRESDPACDLDVIPNQGRSMGVQAALCNCLGFGSKNSALVVGSP